jgi:hypothetical protein
LVDHPRASVEIDAPLDLVWSVMLDVDRYPEWNTFVVRADCPSPPAVGDPIRLHVRWADGGRATSPERITAVEQPEAAADGVRRAALAYAYEGLPARLGLVRSVRWQRLTQPSGQPTTYDTVGEFAGPFVRFAGPDRIEDGFRRHAEALRQRAESLV